MWDVEAEAWAEEALQATELTVDQLPRVRSATDAGGRLCRTWADLRGLQVGTPVIVGATDTAAELISVGACAPGASLVKVASTGTVVTVTTQPRPSPLFLTYPHPLDGMWYAVAVTTAAATSLVWLARALGEDSVTNLERAATDVPAGAGGLLFLPALEGERTPHWDPDLRGAFVGLSSAHTRAHLARSVLEGVALSLRSARDALTDAGHQVDSPAFTGGGFESRLWRSICAAALGLDGVRPAQHGPALGVALLALGLNGPPKRGGDRIAVDTGWADVYTRLHDVQRRAILALAQINHDLVNDLRAH
jgi:xylulokinase